MWIVLVFVVFDAALASSSCQDKCLCPAKRPSCPTGVSVVPDGCGCCKVCARQLNEDCSKREPCDPLKGLECNFGGQYGSAKGICRARADGQTCEFNKRIYQNGEIFRPNCKHQCTCQDGAVGCVSLCPRELPLPKERCPHPRLLKVPGQCCEQLVCPEDLRRIKKYRRKQRLSEDNGEKATMWTEMETGFRAYDSKGRFGCAPQSTAWSPCSRSCGPGLSTRMIINRETHCQMKTETRICEVRPCDRRETHKNSLKCKEIETSMRPMRLSFEGCRSLRRLEVRFCGSCSDGRCCRPDQTRTEPELFRCGDGATVSRMVMKIQTCACDHYCSEKMSSLHKVYNDINKVKH